MPGTASIAAFSFGGPGEKSSPAALQIAYRRTVLLPESFRAVAPSAPVLEKPVSPAQGFCKALPLWGWESDKSIALPFMQAGAIDLLTVYHSLLQAGSILPQIKGSHMSAFRAMENQSMPSAAALSACGRLLVAIRTKTTGKTTTKTTG